MAESAATSKREATISEFLSEIGNDHSSTKTHGDLPKGLPVDKAAKRYALPEISVPGECRFLRESSPKSRPNGSSVLSTQS